MPYAGGLFCLNAQDWMAMVNKITLLKATDGGATWSTIHASTGFAYLSDAGFDSSFLSAFRTRLVEQQAETLLLEGLLEGGQQRVVLTRFRRGRELAKSAPAGSSAPI